MRERRYNNGNDDEGYVSIHAPVRERPHGRLHRSTLSRFNSRSREGATSGNVQTSKWWLVSIHAPVRERLKTQLIKRFINVSIHAPVRERLRRHVGSTERIGFNSRSRKGATQEFNLHTFFGDVSIHAPVRERHRRYIRRLATSGFNSRSRKGATSFKAG